MNNQQAQAKLIQLGLLDPPADGLWGNYSKLALQMFQAENGLESDGLLMPSTKAKLEVAAAKTLTPYPTLAYQVAKFMERQGMFLSRGKGLVNIVYLEGVSVNGQLNSDRIDEWNDLRMCFEIVDGEAIELGRWAATTEPGWYWRKGRRGNPDGAFQIAFGQYLGCWQVGMHRNNHEALVQCAPVSGYRDFNEDGSRLGDKLYTGIFGINQHWGYDMEQVGKASAGCLVGQKKAGHINFMRINKGDRRCQLNRSYRFNTTVLNGQKVLK